MPYLLVRPVLRHALGETEHTPYETALLNSLRSRLDKRTPAELFPKSKDAFASQGTGVESIFAALLLGSNSPAGTLSKDAEKAFDRMWSLQLREGDAAGAWHWFSLELGPWEMPESAYHGAALAALAMGTAPTDYQARPAVRENVARLQKHLRDRQAGQPMHNRLMLLWASTAMPNLLTAAERRGLIDEVLGCQQKDGAWTIESLGAFKKHVNAPSAPGSNAYATAMAAFILQRAGTRDARLSRSLEWLRANQDRATGYWDATSMNKQFPADSMMQGFMRDAATSFAALALLDSVTEPRP
jgi:squalene-hopene/tetraprenyl-beta-curcumene cyclase